MFPALARFCYRRRWLVVSAWIVALIAMNVLSGALGPNFSTNFSAPDTESSRATKLLAAQFKAQSGDTVQVAMRATPSMNDPAVRTRVGALRTALAHVPHVTAVSDPYVTPGAISKSGTIALANAQLDSEAHAIPNSVGQQMIDVAEQHSDDALQVHLGGQLIMQSERPKPPASELIGILAAVVILLIAFGSVLATVVPIAVALAGIAVGLPIIGLLTHVYPLQSFSTTLATMIGIGVGIDYALFVVTRYRQALQAGHDPETAVVTAIDTSGRAVVFAGMTVIIALLGMLAIGLAFISGLGMGAASVVAVTVLAAVTLLPAILGFVGTNIDRLSLPWVHHEQTDHVTVWHRWSRFVQRHSWPLALVGLLVMLVLSAPVLSMRLGFGDAGNNPTSSQSRQAYDLLSEGFGPGFNGPFVLAVDLTGHNDAGVLTALGAAVAQTEGVATVTPAITSPSGTTAVIRVYPETAPQDQATSDLLTRLRDDVIPKAVAGTGARVYVGGFAATADDFAALLAARLPVFIGVVLLLSFLLLMVVFRSLLVPLKAAIMNLLSVGAAYGVVVAIFQWGWGKDLVGVAKEGPIQAFMPMMMFAILFGLSMDYEVFLLSRIREEYLRSGDNATAVADGLSATARVITAAAAIMCTFFLSFVLGDNVIIKLFGIGFSVAIFIDATLVRLVIVPSSMELLGDANWWLPRWLDRILPHLDVEGHALAAATSEDEDDPSDLVGVS
jgi:putative drug exporter of the RND superfamily